MTLARRERQALRQIDRELGRSVSRLHVSFREFTQARAGQAMPRQERVVHRRDQLWRVLRQLLAPAVFITAVVAGGGLNHARHAAKHCAGPVGDEPRLGRPIGAR